MADYYLCPWGQVLDSVIPAGVRSGAGTRMATLLSVPEEIVANRGEHKLPAKQAAVLDYVLAHPESTPAQVATAVGCTQAPVTTLRRKGLLASETRRRAVEADPEAMLPQEPHLEMNPDQSAALGTIMQAIEAGRHETIFSARRYREWKDRSVSSGHSRSGRFRPAGDCPGSGNFAHAANRLAVSIPLRPRRGPAQSLERRRAAPAVGPDCQWRRPGGRRCTERHFCAHTPARSDRDR